MIFVITDEWQYWTLSSKFQSFLSIYIYIYTIYIYIYILYIYIIYMKSSFPKRDKRQIEKKWVRHAIWLCMEPSQCSITVSCQIANISCLKCTARCSSSPNAIKRAEPVVAKCDISSRSIRIRSMHPTWQRFEKALLCSVFKWVI